MNANERERFDPQEFTTKDRKERKRGIARELESSRVIGVDSRSFAV
jgi:hypothetical protein